MLDFRLRGVVRPFGFSVYDLKKPLDWRGSDRAHGQALVSHVIDVDANYLHHNPVIGDGGSLVCDRELGARFQVVYDYHGVPFRADKGWATVEFPRRLKTTSISSYGAVSFGIFFYVVEWAGRLYQQ